MRKWIFSMALVFALITGVTLPQTCEATIREPVEVVDGVAYYKGDLNLPVFSPGTGGFSVAEVNSSVLVNDSEKTAVVDFYGFMVEYRRGWNEPVDPPREFSFAVRRLVYHKDSQKAEIVNDGFYMSQPDVKMARLLYNAAKEAKGNELK